MSKDDDIELLRQMIVVAICHVHRVGARPAIAEHLLDALREMADDAFEDPPQT